MICFRTPQELKAHNPFITQPYKEESSVFSVGFLGLQRVTRNLES